MAKNSSNSIPTWQEVKTQWTKITSEQLDKGDVAVPITWLQKADSTTFLVELRFVYQPFAYLVKTLNAQITTNRNHTYFYYIAFNTSNFGAGISGDEISELYVVIANENSLPNNSDCFAIMQWYNNSLTFSKYDGTNIIDVFDDWALHVNISVI